MPSPALKAFDALIGDWDVELPDYEDRAITVRGRATFEWMKGGSFLIYRWETPAPYPDGIAIIGCAEETGTCSMHYFDERGVARVYEASLRDGVLSLWRASPGFSQRFRGVVRDGSAITGAWERSSDGSSWEHDFDVTYRKVR